MLVPKWLADAAAVAKLNQLYSLHIWDLPIRCTETQITGTLDLEREGPCHVTGQHFLHKCHLSFQVWIPDRVTRSTVFGLSQCSTSVDNLQVHVECFVLILVLQRETAPFKTVTNRRFLLCLLRFSNHNQTKQKRYTRRCEISTLRAVYIPGKHCRQKHTGAKLS